MIADNASRAIRTSHGVFEAVFSASASTVGRHLGSPLPPHSH
jgi:hypothetical protein